MKLDLFSFFQYGILTGIMVFLSAVFSGFENGFVSLLEARLRHAETQGLWSAKALLYLRRHPYQTFAGILLGTNLTRTFGIIYFTHWIQSFVPFTHPIIYDFCITLSFTFIMLEFAELTPKTWFRKAPFKHCSLALPIILSFQLLAYPFIWLISKVVQMCQRWIPDKSIPREVLMRQDFPAMLRHSENVGFLETTLRVLLSNTLHYDQVKVQDFCCPIPNVISISTHLTLLEAAHYIKPYGFSRFPAYDNESPTQQRWIGIFNFYDVLYDIPYEEWNKKKVKEILRPLTVVKESAGPREVLRLSLLTRSPMLVVVNEKGEHTGIVTVTDVIRLIQKEPSSSGSLCF